MTQTVKPTIEEFVDSLSPEERKEYDKEYREFVLSELVLAAMEEDDISVRRLAKLAEVSPTVVQAMRSGIKKDFALKSFFKVLKGLGYTFLLEKGGQTTRLEI